MSDKTYQLSITKSDGSVSSAQFTIPIANGNYALDLTFSDGTTVNVGNNITVSDTENRYVLSLTRSDNTQIACSGEIVTPIGYNINSVFSENSLADICAACDNNIVPSTWNLGDTIPIVLYDPTKTYTNTYQFAIIGKRQDTLTTPYADGRTMAELTLGMVRTSSYSTYTYSAGRTADGLYQFFTSDTQPYLKRSKKKVSTTSNTVSKIDMYAWYPSYSEILGQNYSGPELSIYTVAGEGEQYQYYANAPIPSGLTAVSGTTGTCIGDGSYHASGSGTNVYYKNGYYCNYYASKPSSSAYATRSLLYSDTAKSLFMGGGGYFSYENTSETNYISIMFAI